MKICSTLHHPYYTTCYLEGYNYGRYGVFGHKTKSYDFPLYCACVNMPLFTGEKIADPSGAPYPGLCY